MHHPLGGFKNSRKYAYLIKVSTLIQLYIHELNDPYKTLRFSNRNFQVRGNTKLQKSCYLGQEPLNTWTGRLLGIFLTFYPWRILRNDNNITCAAMKK